MKKIFGLLMAITMVSAFAIGCGDKKKTTTTTTTPEGDKTTTTKTETNK